MEDTLSPEKLQTSHQIYMFNLLQLRAALRLEIAGLHHSQGSAYAYIKKRFGITGNKRAVLAQLDRFIERMAPPTEEAF